MSYHGYSTMALENEHLRVVVTPELGAKIVSLYDRRAGREWLVTPEQSGMGTPNGLRAWPYGTEYNPNQCGGWDEMIPTILACSYPGEGPYQGAELPDHGEAWTQPWADSGSGPNCLSLELIGTALPYRLRRLMSLRDDALLISYHLRNEGPAPLRYLWAAHPQFACEPGAMVVLPDSVHEVVNALPLEWGREFGPPGTCNAWPSFTFEGRTVHQDRISGPEKRGGRKFYVPPASPTAWAELRQPGGEWLRMCWDPKTAPYCGVWIDEGYLNRVSDVAFEPTSGYYDNLATAWTTCPTLQPGAETLWTLDIQVGK